MDSRLDKRPEGLINAINMAKSTIFPNYSKIARLHKVNRRTLQRQCTKPTTRQIGQETNQTLSYRLELLLVQWVIQEDLRGCPPTYESTRKMAQAMVECMSMGNPETTIGKNWVSRFIRRNPQVKSTIAKRVESARIDAIEEDILIGHLKRFDQAVKEYDVKPCNIWNMDETGSSIGSINNENVLASSSNKTTYTRAPNTREWVSVIECISATGSYIQPLMIFKGQEVQLQWFNSENVPNAFYAASENGWTSNDLGLEWLKSIFIPETQPNDDEWRILVLDGHGSHITPFFHALAMEHKVYLHWLPPHSSHVTQPLNLCVFSSLKRMIKKHSMNMVNYHNDSRHKKELFIEAYTASRKESLSVFNITSGFKAAGLHPISTRTLLMSPFLSRPSTLEISSTLESSPTRRSKAKKVNGNVFATSKKTQDVKNYLELSSERDKKNALVKICKLVDHLTSQIALSNQRIKALEAQIPDKSTKKRHAITPCNYTNFVSKDELVKSINSLQEHAIQTAPKRHKMTSNTHQKIHQSGEGNMTFINMCSEFQLN